MSDGAVRCYRPNLATGFQSREEDWSMIILKNRLAALAFGLTVTVLASPSYAQIAGRETSARAARPPSTSATSWPSDMSRTPGGDMAWRERITACASRGTHLRPKVQP